MAGFLKGLHRCTEMLENKQDLQGETHPIKPLIFLQIPSKYHAVCIL